MRRDIYASTRKMSAMQKVTHELHTLERRIVIPPENQMALQYQCRDRTREPVGTSIPMHGPHQRTSWYFNTNAGTAPESQLVLEYQCRDCTGEPVGAAIPMQGPHQRTRWHFSTNGTAPENQLALRYNCRDRTRNPGGTSIPLQELH